MMTGRQREEEELIRNTPEFPYELLKLIWEHVTFCRRVIGRLQFDAHLERLEETDGWCSVKVFLFLLTQVLSHA